MLGCFKAKILLEYLHGRLKRTQSGFYYLLTLPGRGQPQSVLPSSNTPFGPIDAHLLSNIFVFRIFLTL
jgi:hypothetical protein